MENLGKKAEQKKSDWFIATGSTWTGPFSTEEVYEKVVCGEITWAHYAWKAGQSEWKRLCDLAQFQKALPVQPTAKVLNELKTLSRTFGSSSRKSGSDLKAQTQSPSESQAETLSSAAVSQKKVWFLYDQSLQSGPYALNELPDQLRSRLFLSSGASPKVVYLWKEGMKDWKRVQEVEEVMDDLSVIAVFDEISKNKFKEQAKTGARLTVKATGASPISGDKRNAPRQPLVARVWLSNDKTLMMGVCRDISIGGMQVLTDRMPGKPGSKIKLNVSPAQELLKGAKSSKSFEAFVAEGVIVRILEDHRGFSFRFDKLSAAARRNIEAYLSL